MRVLLDTHILIWALVEPFRLSPKVQAILEDTWWAAAKIDPTPAAQQLRSKRR
jgi:PIN domain nuclease of toxin-antitoxin system